MAASSSTTGFIATNLFDPQNLPTAATTIYTVPTSPNTTALVRGRVRFTNTTSSDRTVTAYAVEVGGLPAAHNQFFPGMTVKANTFTDTDVPVIGPGGYISAFADTGAAVNIQQIDGMLMSSPQ